MRATLLKTSLFLKDYRAIALRLAKANPNAAERFCDAVEQALDLLTRHPQIGPLAKFTQAPKTRRWVLQSFPNYTIYYEDRSGELLVIRLLHGARNIPALIPEE